MRGKPTEQLNAMVKFRLNDFECQTTQITRYDTALWYGFICMRACIKEPANQMPFYETFDLNTTMRMNRRRQQQQQ